MNKAEVFRKEIDWIVDPKLKHFAETAISMLPDYFFRVAASSTGKYHPPYALGEGGLVRHTKAAVHIAHELLNLEMYRYQFAQPEIDLMLIALMLHDGWKHGKEAEAGRYTVAEHPLVCAEWIKESEYLRGVLSEPQLDFLCSGIAAHMGQWNTDYKTKKEILPKPQTEAQKFIHLCDYLASRRYLNFDFGDDYYKPAAPDKEETPEFFTQIIEKCRNLISVSGVDRNKIYEVIAAANNGKKNPNTIKTKERADQVMAALDALEVV